MYHILNGLSYLRGPLITLVGIVHTFIQSIVVIVAAWISGGNARVIDFIAVYIWSRPILWLSGVRLVIRGREHLDMGGKGFLILFNHSSNYDIPVLFCFPRSFRYGAKVELFKIPFFGRAMKVCGVLPIDRGNREKVMQVYENAIARVEKGESFALAPEGTRQHQPRIGSFKRGPFEFALNARMDIVPAVLAGVYEVLPKRAVFVNMGRWRRTVIMEILPRVPTQGLDPSKLDELVQKVRKDFEATFIRNHDEILKLNGETETA
jgi:1-acyl-sn-glycerol-3-phosphate acyltransferase